MDYTAINPTTTSQAMSKIERLIAGEDADSIGTMLTNPMSQQTTKGNTLTPLTGGSISGTNIDSNHSTAGKSVVTYISREQTETDLVMDQRVSTMENILLLIARRLDIDINFNDSNEQTNKATSSDNEDGCTPK